MKLLCHLIPCKWVHITDIHVGRNQFDIVVTRGLWQCVRCGELSLGQCGNKVEEPEEK
ncbi:hypothetical protein LCGC14_2645730 [marine sediment metagenome]|uniref:Uncharacterized protein n=1 Tax=marine sediment metagenome TaxID=412755 RepID=A0A0F8ZWB3_9ZZZZ